MRTCATCDEDLGEVIFRRPEWFGDMRVLFLGWTRLGMRFLWERQSYWLVKDLKSLPLAAFSDRFNNDSCGWPLLVNLLCGRLTRFSRDFQWEISPISTDAAFIHYVESFDIYGAVRVAASHSPFMFFTGEVRLGLLRLHWGLCKDQLQHCRNLQRQV